MKLQINRKITAQSVIAGIVFAASAAGLNFSTWTPHSVADWIRVGVVFVIGFVVALLGLNTQDPASATFVKDALAIFEQIMSAHPDLKPETREALTTQVVAAKRMSK